MENSSTFPEHSVYTALAMIDDLFGLDIEQSRFEEWAMIAIQKIGTNTELVKIQGTVEEGGVVELPCRAKIIKAVTSDLSVYSQWEGINVGADDMKVTDRHGSTFKDGSISGGLPKGNYVNFTPVSRTRLKVDDSLVGSYVYVLVYTSIEDEKGWPMFTQKQVEAIAYYVAYLYVQREAFRGIKLPVDLNWIKAEAGFKIGASKIPDYISDNAMNQILDAKTRFGRKRYNKDFKAEL